MGEPAQRVVRVVGRSLSPETRPHRISSRGVSPRKRNFNTPWASYFVGMAKASKVFKSYVALRQLGTTLALAHLGETIRVLKKHSVLISSSGLKRASATCVWPAMNCQVCQRGKQRYNQGRPQPSRGRVPNPACQHDHAQHSEIALA